MIDFLSLPETQTRANLIGETFYFTNKPCRRGHLAPRYASSGNCRDCISHTRGKAKMNFRHRSSMRSEKNQERAMAAAGTGETTYFAIDKCKKGHRKRWISTNNCVECNKDTMEKRKKTYRWTRIKSEYGLTKDEFYILLENQSCRCCICQSEISETSCHIDHCHAGGFVRGLLCPKCNQGIGLLQESEAILTSAITYLRKHNGV